MQPNLQNNLQLEASTLRQEAKEEKEGRERAEVRAEELQKQLDAKTRPLPRTWLHSKTNWIRRGPCTQPQSTS